MQKSDISFLKKFIRVTLFIALAAVCAFGLIFVSLMGGPLLSDYVQRRSFDSSIWKNSLKSDKDEVRIHMVDDLLDHHRLVGLPQSDIDNLLGRPPSTEYFRAYDYVYWLGPERGFISIDSEWLAIKFRAGVVSEAQIVRD